MKLIQLSKGLFAKVDDEDFEAISRLNWHARHALNVRSHYAVRDIRSEGKRRLIFMHRLIMNATEGVFVDHINHDTLDNQRHNLRLCTPADNCKNRRKNIGSASMYKGVQKVKRYGKEKWGVSIRTDKINKWVGYFQDEKEAAIAYNNEAIKLHGEFALLNIVN